MSAPLNRTDILFFQRLLKASGFYGGALNGRWDDITDKAERDFLLASDKLRHDVGEFDSRTERQIATLHIKAQRIARQFMLRATTGNKICKIISGNRTYEEQNRLFRQGRWGNPGPIVTNARGGQSNHNFAIAWDIGLFERNGSYLNGGNLAELREYEHIAEIVDLSELEWGGYWRRPDRPHYQVKSQVEGSSRRRALFEAGKPYL